MREISSIFHLPCDNFKELSRGTAYLPALTWGKSLPELTCTGEGNLFHTSYSNVYFKESSYLTAYLPALTWGKFLPELPALVREISSIFHLPCDNFKELSRGTAYLPALTRGKFLPELTTALMREISSILHIQMLTSKNLFIELRIFQLAWGKFLPELTTVLMREISSVLVRIPLFKGNFFQNWISMIGETSSVLAHIVQRQIVIIQLTTL